jgi:hypothetical protein
MLTDRLPSAVVYINAVSCRLVPPLNASVRLHAAMSEGTVGIVILSGLILVSSVLSHLHISRVWAAAFVSAFVSALTFQVLARLHLGYWDPFWPIALFTTLVLAFVGALLIGLTMRWLGVAVRKRRAT